MKHRCPAYQRVSQVEDVPGVERQLTRQTDDQYPHERVL